MDDLVLLARIQNREQEAMIQLHQRYVDLVYSIAYRILGEATASEEAAQDAFMKVWQSAATFDTDKGTPVAWLARITRNVAIDRLRQRSRQSGLDDSLEAGDIERISPNLVEWVDRDRLPGLKMAMERLPPDQAQVIALAYFGGLSHSEIAEQLSIPLGTVKTRMRVGMQRLREQWGEGE
jgi:RNA polymerase sigma-70 factor (ECF subfamily)